jgi:hypothetical protein
MQMTSKNQDAPPGSLDPVVRRRPRWVWKNCHNCDGQGWEWVAFCNSGSCRICGGKGKIKTPNVPVRDGADVI